MDGNSGKRAGMGSWY